MYTDEVLDRLLIDFLPSHIQNGAEVDAAHYHQIHRHVAEGMEPDPSAMLRRLYGITIIAGEYTVLDKDLAVYHVIGALGIRNDTAHGVSSLTGLTGLDYANAIKAAETNAKTRLTASLLGYGRKMEVANPVAEPQVPVVPPVNQGQASVTADTRQDAPVERMVTMIVPEPLTPTRVETTPFPPTPPVPAVPESALADMHRTAQAEHNAQTVDVTSVAPKPAPAEAASIFDMEDAATEVPVAAQVYESLVPNVAAPAMSSTTQSQVTPSAPSTADITSVAPVASTGTTLPPTNSPAAEPTPIQDVSAEPATSEVPTPAQYKAFTARTTKLVRDRLAKVDKNAGVALLPYLRKKLGVHDLSKASVLLWETNLAELESLEPAKAFAIIKGGK